MNSTKEIQTETYYSPYGYIQVSKEEYNSPSQIIKFTKKNSFKGSINVKIILYNQKKKLKKKKLERTFIKENYNKFKNILW